MKEKKRTIKFKANQQKAGSQNQNNWKGGRKRPKSEEDFEEESAENYINLKTPVSKKSKKDNSTKGHKDELNDLQKSDPEFYQFLKKNDTSLLDFQSDEDDGDDDEESDSVDNDGEDEDSDDDNNASDEDAHTDRKRDSRKRIEITAAIVDEAAHKSLVGGSLNELKKLLSMFRSACIPSGEADAEESSMRSSEGEAPVSRYFIPSAEIYEKVMVTTIETAHVVFSKLLDLKNVTKKSLEGLSKHPKWKKLQLLVLSYFKSIMHTLAGLVDSSKQSHVSVFLIDSLEPYIPFLSALPRLAKNLVKVLLTMWAQQSDSPTTSSDGSSTAAITGVVTGLGSEQLLVRGHAFLRIRQIAVQLPGAIGEECFRSIYLKFARQNKTYNEFTAPNVVFMIQSVAELFGCDLALAYQQSFLYIRQLALHLRAALLKKSEETTRQITSMQYLNCIRLWTRVICCHSSTEAGLGALAFPLTQIILGTITALPSIYYTPLKFNLITCLHQIAAACQVFIPTTTQVIEVLEHSDLTAKTIASTDLAPKLEYLVRLPANSVAKAVVRDALVLEAAQLIRQDAEIYRYHVGLPEYTYLTIRKLKAFLKKCKITKWRDVVRTVTGQLEQYSMLVQRARDSLKDTAAAPMSVACEFEPLLPLNALPAKMRLHKLLVNNKNGVVAVDESLSVKKTSNNAAAVTAPKDLFTSSYSAIRTEQLKQAKAAAKARAKKASTNSDDDDGNDDDGTESEDQEGDDDDDSFNGAEEEEDVYEGIEEEGDEFEVMDDSEEEEEEVKVHLKKSKKGNNNSSEQRLKKKVVGDSSNKKKKLGKAATTVDTKNMKDTVSVMNWDDDDDDE